MDPGRRLCSGQALYGLVGVSATDNVPGGRSNAVIRVNSAASVWLFGGYGIDSTGALGTLCDLWQLSRRQRAYGPGRVAP
jgi:hypothetical protein